MRTLLSADLPGGAKPPHAMLEVHDLAARRGALTLFERLSLHVPAGQALVVSGRNGTGKTTLLRMLAGLTEPAAGAIAWNGAPIAARDPATRSQVLFAGHLPALKDELTVTENLRALVTLAGTPMADAALQAALDTAGLRSRRDLPARALSQGQRRRVSLARLALGTHGLWILDEPATALDTDGLALLATLIARHLAKGGTAVAATHQALDLPPERVQALELA